MRILLIFLFLLPFAASSQTREETEAWIMSKADVRAYELGLHYRIEEGEMIQLIEPISVLVGVGSDIEKSIPLESVKTISYKHTDEFLSFVLKCEYDCVYSVVTDPNGKMEKDKYINQFLLEIYEKVDVQMVSRMQKALLHLVKLHGGDAKLVPLVEPKEPF